MSNDNSNSKNGAFWPVTIALALTLLGLYLMGFGPGCKNCVAAPVTQAATLPTTAAVSEPAATVAPAAETAAPVADTTAAVAPPVPNAKVYFGLAKTALPADTDTSLAEVVAYLKANPNAKASVSGFHDPSGSPATNDALANGRATEVVGALAKLGIGADRVTMAKPTTTTGTGTNAEARRVEVAVTN